MTQNERDVTGLSEPTKLIISLLRLTIELTEKYRGLIEKDIQSLEGVDHHEHENSG